jgi:hypothetical protein
MRGAIPPLPQYAFMAWCSVKAQWLYPLSVGVYMYVGMQAWTIFILIFINRYPFHLQNTLVKRRQQSPSSQANSSSARQEISLLWDPKVHYRVHKSPPPDLIFSHMNLTHNFGTCFSHLRLVHPSDLFPSGFRLICYALFKSHTRGNFPAHVILPFITSNRTIIRLTAVYVL